MSRWTAARLKAAAAHAEALQTDLIELAEHMAFLMLPLAAALMGLMFFWRRGVYIFDHLIFSMHSLVTFQERTDLVRHPWRRRSPTGRRGCWCWRRSTCSRI